MQYNWNSSVDIPLTRMYVGGRFDLAVLKVDNEYSWADAADWPEPRKGSDLELQIRRIEERNANNQSPGTP